MDESDLEDLITCFFASSSRDDLECPCPELYVCSPTALSALHIPVYALRSAWAIIIDVVSALVMSAGYFWQRSRAHVTLEREEMAKATSAAGSQLQHLLSVAVQLLVLVGMPMACVVDLVKLRTASRQE
eukprot:4739117-Amphidinium_carterae.1